MIPSKEHVVPSPQMQEIIDALWQRRAARASGPAAGAPAALLYLHGGGYQLGSVRSHGPLAAELGRATGRPTLLPEYRLAPEHPFPAAVEDTLAARVQAVNARRLGQPA